MAVQLVVFCFDFGRHLAFAFHLFSNNVRIADQRQYVLMTVRASSVHGMSSKKKAVAVQLVQSLDPMR